MEAVQKRVAVIGSGMAGLIAGAYLARDGHKVTVYEQFLEPGGVTATIKRDGFSWDLGPLLLEGFGPGEIGTRILEEIGVPAPRARALATEPSDRGIVFPDFALWRPQDYQGAYWRKDHLRLVFPEDARGLDRYYRFYRRMYRLVTLNRRAEMRDGRAAALDQLRMALNFLLVKSFGSQSAAQLMEHFFNSPKLRAV